MRLLRTDVSFEDRPDLALEEFYGSNIPTYAILSHTWGEEEVLLADVLNGTAVSKKGFSKIRRCVEQARDDGYPYAWVDTCCIDKTSSAELSEAINSMYSWYQSAAKCYAYLIDVPATVDLNACESEFTRSRWFTRGFCLQELLAPQELIFYSEDWVSLGSKNNLRQQVSSITRIDPAILSGEQSLDTISVAQKMAWAANRQTTRPEDIAYCLMGLFSVNMPMLYGEGSKAFHRLQEEIIKQSPDHSIFAWTNPNLGDAQMHGLLADSPLDFANSIGVDRYSIWEEPSPFDIGNLGLHITLHLTDCGDEVYAAALNCPVPYGNAHAHAHAHGKFLAIYVQRLQPGIERYARIRCAKFAPITKRGHKRAIYVQQKISDADLDLMHPTHIFQLRGKNNPTQGYDLMRYVRPKLQLMRGYSPDYSSVVLHHSELPWVPLRIPTFYEIAKGADVLSAAIYFGRKSDDEGFWLLMGSITNRSIGFNIIDRSVVDIGSMKALHPFFKPEPPGKPLLLDYHHVRVRVVIKIKQGVKVYEMEITIKGIPKATLTTQPQSSGWRSKALQRIRRS